LRKTSRIIDNEDIADMCYKWIRNNKSHTTLHQFKEFVQNILLPKTGINKNVISISTARRWLNILRYYYQQQKQGIYYDGYEREDVVEYQKVFLLKMAELEKYMVTYEEDDMEKISPLLIPKEKEHILIVYDECIFYSNDGKCGI